MACPYVANADALTQSLEDIDEHGNRPDKFKKKVGSMLLLLFLLLAIGITHRESKV